MLRKFCVYCSHLTWLTGWRASVLPFLIPSHIQSAICKASTEPRIKGTSTNVCLDALAEKIADDIVKDAKTGKPILVQQELKA